ncbi:NAC domain-containing protein 72 [Ananas comosus]|uniref:NAC domain-containing protein 72 n=2 Tax=Ananas comosus TaxID=4615 RepID=A0A6P5FH73_ANACO|nr:NAC domain-containing protein 72 [Ananas comosus]CAD1819348.1 unnamed protein product [Ananas comosus var. bracteatus]
MGSGRDPVAVSQLSLPPGFRFFPTDVELLVHYLSKKVSGQLFSLPVITDIELYKFDPWDLPGRALFGEKEWYFFSPRDRKYPNGSRPNRMAGSGYWKATGTDKVIMGSGKNKLGIKKALVFYVGKAPKGSKTNWIMHEYRLCSDNNNIPLLATPNSHRLDEWVLCRIYKRMSSHQLTVLKRAPHKCHNLLTTTQLHQHGLYSQAELRVGGAPPLCYVGSPSFDMLQSSSSAEDEVDSSFLFPSRQAQQSTSSSSSYQYDGNANAIVSRFLQSAAGESLNQSFGF